MADLKNIRVAGRVARAARVPGWQPSTLGYTPVPQHCAKPKTHKARHLAHLGFLDALHECAQSSWVSRYEIGDFRSNLTKATV
jgi:hypothetical protein